MEILLAALLLAVAAPLACCQSNCGVAVTEQWISHDSDITVVCEGVGNTSPEWWLMSDPCEQQDRELATRVSACSGQGSCVVTSQMLADLSTCVLCCTQPGGIFTLNSIGVCKRIRVCPSIDVSAPALARTETDIDIFTSVITKPRPPPHSVTVQTLSGDVPIVGSQEIYPSPTGGSNTHVFVHTLQLSRARSSLGSSILVEVNVTGVPRHMFICPFMDTRIVRVSLIKVNSSTTPPPTTLASNQTTTKASPSPVGVISEEPTSTRLSPVSLAIGAGAGVGGMIIIIVIVGGIVLVAWCCARKRSASSSSKSVRQYSTPTGGSSPLLTVNGTPATTPSSEVSHSLGGQSSDTPASTPTEMHDLLPQQSQTNPYQVTRLNTGSNTVSPRVPMVTSSGSSDRPSTTSHQDVRITSGTPLPAPQYPPPIYVASPPKMTQMSGNPEQYHTHGEAMQLNHKYNEEGGAIV